MKIDDVHVSVEFVGMDENLKSKNWQLVKNRYQKIAKDHTVFEIHQFAGEMFLSVNGEIWAKPSHSDIARRLANGIAHNECGGWNE